MNATERSAARSQMRNTSNLCIRKLHEQCVAGVCECDCHGTCFGRQSALQVDELAYRPRTVRWLPSTWCPGPRRGLWVEHTWQLGWCLACRSLQRRWGAGLARHEHHGAGVHCPEHGHRNLYLAGGQVHCHGWSGGGGERGHPCTRRARPFWQLHLNGARR